MKEIDDKLRNSWREFETAVILAKDYYINAQCKLNDCIQKSDALARAYQQARKELEKQVNELNKKINELEKKNETIQN